MGRHVTHMDFRNHGPVRSDPYFDDWAIVVGDRIRRLRAERGWRLYDLARRVRKPDGTFYSAGYFSRLERGMSSPPLYLYIRVAEQFGVSPGELLGADDVERRLSGSQRVLLRFLERAGLEPEDAIARLAGLSPPPPGPARPAPGPRSGSG